jgi:hypothetical protein
MRATSAARRPSWTARAGLTHRVSPPDADHQFGAYVPIGLTLPSDGKLRIVVDAYNDGSAVGGGDIRSKFGVIERYQAGGPPVSSDHPLYEQAYWWDAQWSDDPSSPLGPYNFYHAATGPITGGLGGPLAGGQHVDPLETATFITDIQGQGAAPATLNVNVEGVNAFSFYDGQFTARRNYDTGPPGLILPGQLSGNPARIARFAIYAWNPGVPATGGGFEEAYGEVALNHDPSVETAYQFGARFQHFGAQFDGRLWLYQAVAGSYRLLRMILVSLPHDTELRFSAERRANVIYCYRGDEELLDMRFDLDTDVADDDGRPADIFTGGDPAMDLEDDATTFISQRARAFSLYGPGYDVPCEGTDPGDPYPNPPPPPPVSDVAATSVMKQGLWRAVLGPGPNVATAKISVMANGQLRLLRARWKMKQGLWRPVYSLNGDQLPPPNYPHGPGFDPCAELPPIDIGDVGLDPYTGERPFGMQGVPVTQLGRDLLFNVSQRTGELPSFMIELAQARTRGGSLIGAQGGYKKFINPATGYYDPARMDSFIDGHAPYASAILSYQDDGTLLCFYIIDDFRVQRLWPTKAIYGGGNGAGLSDAEITRIVARWQSAVPGIRCGIRARPRTFGSPIPGLSVYGAQFDGPAQVGKTIGDTVTAADYRSWRDAELAHLLGFGGSQQIIMSPNWAHGGDGESGVQVYTGTMFDGRYAFSAAEAVRCSDGWYGDGGGHPDRIIGNSGYEFIPDVMGVPGILDAMAYMRNGQNSLPPL